MACSDYRIGGCGGLVRNNYAGLRAGPENYSVREQISYERPAEGRPVIDPTPIGRIAI